ncbi:hypothetical protein Bca101_083228 [Brassica carinata]
MKIKTNSKIPKKPKDKQQSRAVEDGECSKISKESTSSTTLEQQPVVTAAPMNSQKLYWGFNTKANKRMVMYWYVYVCVYKSQQNSRDAHFTARFGFLII